MKKETYLFTLLVLIVGATSMVEIPEDEAQKILIQLFTEEAPKYTPTTRGIDNIAECSKGCSYGSLFSSYRPECLKSIRAVGDVLMAQKDAESCLEAAKNLKGHPTLHPMCWYTALTIATLQRPDLRSLWKPSPVDVTPESYLNSDAIRMAKDEPGQCVMLDEKFGEDNGAENRMWYFREDIQVNAQHWFWHLTYPFNRTFRSDRRGELFWYFHHQIMNRYNSDRFANGLSRAKNVRLNPTFVMEEGYNPHLYDPISDVNFLPRKPNTPFPPYVLSGRPSLIDMATSFLHLMQSINSTTYLYPNSTTGPITPLTGFDSFIDTVESTIWSVNLRYYGVLHGSGHTYIAYSSVWNITNSSVYGIMEDVAVSMRDPVFYQWHGFLEDLFLQLKSRLPPYQLTQGDFPLIWNELRLEKVDILPGKTLNTFWSVKNLTLTRRLDIDAGINRNPFKICAKYLNHDSFKYTLSVNLVASTPRNVTVRIFMAPLYDETGSRFSFEEQMKLFIAMDAYKASLLPGKNTLVRESADSSLTIPWGRTLSSMEGILTIDRAFCGCGWPEHLLLPKGTTQGIFYDLVVMLTDQIGDTVGDEGFAVPQACPSAYILGGVWLKKYPDRKPMGYPFDRPPFKKFKDLEEYVSLIPNMATTRITIVHQDQIKTRD